MSHTKLDCVIPAHDKDFETLGYAVSSIRKCCPEVGRIIVISRIEWSSTADATEWFDEAADGWPFDLTDLNDCGCPPGWLFQQLLKLHALMIIPGLASNVLVCDADVIWLGVVHFLQVSASGDLPAARICTFDSEACPPIRSAVDLHRYDAFVPAVVPGIAKPRPGQQTAVCHHSVFQRDVLEGLFARVTMACSGLPFWEAFRNAARACGGRASEYELYHAFLAHAYAERLVHRPLAFAIVGGWEAAVASPPPSVVFLVAHSHLRGLAPEELRDREGVINGDVQAEIVRRLVHKHPPELAALIAGSGML